MTDLPIPPERLFQYDSPCSEYTHPYQILAFLKQQVPALEYQTEGLSILEVGCATCGNLIPIARALQSSQCIGIDPFEAQIQNAQQKIDQLGLKNITLYPIGIEALAQYLPIALKFDLIICHGIMSWIPEEARSLLIESCSAFLKEQGLLYLSYNLNPGWHLKKPARDLMRFHIKNIQQQQPRPQRMTEEQWMIEQQNRLAHESKLILKEFAQRALSREAISLKDSYHFVYQQIISFPDYYLMHEYLLDDNQAYYFEEINQRAQASKLLYLGDMSMNTELAYLSLAYETLAYLKKNAPAKVIFSQYLDFLFNFYLRRSLFIKSNDLQKTVNKFDIQPDLLSYFKGTYLYSSYSFIEQLEQGMLFKSYLPQKKQILIKNHLLQAFFLILSSHDGSISFDELLEQAILVDMELHPSQYQHRHTASLSLLPLIQQQSFYQDFYQEFQKIIIIECIEAPMIAQIKVAQRVEAYPVAFLELQYISESQRVISNAYHLAIPIDQQLNAFLRLANGKEHKTSIYQSIGISDDQILGFEQRLLKLAILAPAT